MLVHTYGHPAEMDEIMRIAKKNKLKVIEDAAPSLGSLYKGQKVGTFGDVGAYSFHGAKIAAAGEGGMFVTNNKKYLENAILLSNMGRTNRKFNFWCDSLGYEYQMANVVAALALSQVERIEELVAKKRQIFDWYYRRLKDADELMLIKEKSYCRSNYAYPAVLLCTKKISRDVLLEKLAEWNIHGRAAFCRMSGFPMYERRFKNSEAQKVEKYGFNLPSAADITEKDVDYVCEKLMKLVS
jgi:perosamine synthetase